MRKTIQKLAVVTASLSLMIGVGSAAAAGPPANLPDVAAKPDTPGSTAGKPDTPGSQGKGKGKGKSNPARACKAERKDIGDDSFRDKYGTGENGKNAFGKCVASKRNQDDGGDTSEPVTS